MCKFCNIEQAHLTRHLKRRHKKEDEVIRALNLPKKDQDRAFSYIRKAGIFKKNMSNRENNLPLIRERVQGASETVMCVGCRGFYDAKTIYKHKKYCENIKDHHSNVVKLNDFPQSAKLAGVDLDYRENVLDRFRKDEVGKICREDFVTILLGKKLWARSSKKERHSTMTDMRILGNIIFGFRSESGDRTKSGIDVLDYRQFDLLENVIKKICGKEIGEKIGLKVRIGFVLKRAVKVMRGYFVQKEDSTKEADMTRFLDVLNLNWDFIFFTAQIECELRRGGLRKPSAMPDEDDISLLKTFINDDLKKLTDQYELWDRHQFVQVRNLVVARLTIFNARRGGEPARLTLREWKEAMEGSWIDPHLVDKIDNPTEKHLIQKLKLAYQSGKGSRKMVPVLITEDIVEPITRLLTERKRCNVPDDNTYLFPNTGQSNDHVSGYYCLKSVVDKCPGLKKPQLLIADKFRHRVSTIYANLDVPAEQRQFFYNHMGHSESMNKNVYQCPMAIREVTKVGNFLLNNIDHDSDIPRNIGTNSSTVNSNENEPEMVIGVDNRGTNSSTANSMANEIEMAIGDEIIDSDNTQSAFDNRGKNSSTANSMANEIEMTIGDEIIDSDNTQSAFDNHGTNSSTANSMANETEMSVDNQVFQPNNKQGLQGSVVCSGTKKRQYTKWDDKDSKLVKNYFKDYITDVSNNGRLPGKKEVLKFLETYPILQSHKNRVYCVKTKVFNEKKNL